jgi:hypothetical protein
MGTECSTFRCPQRSDLIDKVDNIEGVKLPRLEESSLRLRRGAGAHRATLSEHGFLRGDTRWPVAGDVGASPRPWR